MNVYKVTYRLVDKPLELTATIRANSPYSAIFQAGVAAASMKDSFGSTAELEYVDYDCAEYGDL